MSASPCVLYRFFSESHELLYIGATQHPLTRFHAHQTTQEWWPEVSYITVDNFDSRRELLRAEHKAIAAERPRYNIRLNDGMPAHHYELPADWQPQYSFERSYSLAEVAALALPSDQSNPEDWLLSHLQRGDIAADKIGGLWSMTGEQIDQMVNDYSNITVTREVVA